MNWLSWVALAISLVSFVIATRTYLRARRQLKQVEEQRERVELSLKAWNAAIRRMNGGRDES
jgi:heme exporter protein D